MVVMFTFLIQKLKGNSRGLLFSGHGLNVQSFLKQPYWTPISLYGT